MRPNDTILPGKSQEEIGVPPPPDARDPFSNGTRQLPFLTTLYGGLPPGAWVYVWAKTPGGEARTHWTQDIGKAAETADRLGTDADVYCPVAFADRKGTTGQRMIAATDPKSKTPLAAGRIGFICDLDYRNEKHPANPVNRAEALTLVAALPLPPTIIVDSGHGLHLWWLLASPWAFADEADRVRCARIAEGWQRRLEAVAKEHGTGLDTVQDLPRILRVPGTTNHKGDPCPVELVEFEADRRYTVEEFEAAIGDVQAKTTTAKPPAPARAPTAVDLSDQELLAKARAAKNGTEFTALYDHGNTTAYDADDSRADAALCAHLAFWFGCDPARMDRAFRGSRLMREKWDRADYRERTIERAIELTTETYTPPQERGEPAPKVSEPVSEGTVGQAADSATAAADDEAEHHDLREVLPTICVSDRHGREIVDEALAALVAANDPPVVFCRGTGFVAVERDKHGRPHIVRLEDRAMRARLDRVADFSRMVKADKEWKQVPLAAPPKAVVEALLAEGHTPFPGLDAVVESPVLRPDGTLLHAEGYDPTTWLYLSAGDVRVQVPEVPSAEDVDKAKNLIHSAIGEFAFVDDASYAGAVALLLTLLVRPAVDLSPVALVDSPQAGVGKGLLCDLGAVIATGTPAAVIPCPRDDDEWRKQLASFLLAGASCLIFDNLEVPLKSPSLAAFVTCVEYQTRLLGTMTAIRLPNRATVAVTGNNIILRGDMPRRCHWIRQDPKVFRPWQRDGFTHADLLSWATENRAALLGALLTLARSWYAAGRPEPALRPLGSFRQWTNMVGGILANAGIEGFLGNLDELYDVADEEGTEWDGFLHAWHDLWGDSGVVVADVFAAIEQGLAEDPTDYNSETPERTAAERRITLAQAVPTAAMNRNKLDRRRLGWALKAKVGAVFSDGLHLQCQGDRTRNRVWTVKGV